MKSLLPYLKILNTQLVLITGRHRRFNLTNLKNKQILFIIGFAAVNELCHNCISVSLGCILVTRIVFGRFLRGTGVVTRQEK